MKAQRRAISIFLWLISLIQTLIPVDNPLHVTVSWGLELILIYSLSRIRYVLYCL